MVAQGDLACLTAKVNAVSLSRYVKGTEIKMLDKTMFYIGGAWVKSADGCPIPVINPATKESLCHNIAWWTAGYRHGGCGGAICLWRLVIKHA
jgi:hypothetical protein